MLDHMQTQLEARITERETEEKRRDELLAELPRRSAESALKQSFRDDPVVLARTGWKPSRQEAAYARELDGAYVLANQGQWSDARDVFLDVLGKTENPALEQRARYGLTTSRKALAAQVATDWQQGVVAEIRAELPAARAAYRRVLSVDQDNPSARVRLSYLGAGPNERAEARR